MFRYVPIVSALVASTLVGATGVEAQSFSCPIGREPACLDYGAVVCRSLAKCVSNDAICFNSYTCDFKGFVCKSKLDEIADEHENNIRKHNELVENYNMLQARLRSLGDEIENLESDLQGSKGQLDLLRRCVGNASDLEEAQDCKV